MFKDIIETFRKPSAKVVAQRELEEAQCQLLQDHTGGRMAQYHSDRIKRLTTFLKDGE